ncbi:hypothetical protein PRZ48_014806 [Zasmidium cellare]|uniref:Uncharacterized protein n=1 Tax=Zasmidium cellare TaxID=395010 RepID=A0ABR0DZA1_ZASCE|nr:hypothetical protein PRZ48_014806 [Zasmidium cellare]
MSLTEPLPTIIDLNSLTSFLPSMASHREYVVYAPEDYFDSGDSSDFGCGLLRMLWRKLFGRRTAGSVRYEVDYNARTVGYEGRRRMGGTEVQVKASQQRLRKKPSF